MPKPGQFEQGHEFQESRWTRFPGQVPGPNELKSFRHLCLC